MLHSDALIKKLVRLSFYTSLLIAGLSVIPFFQIYNTAPGEFYVIVTLIISANILMIWLLNILLFYLFEKYGNKNRRTNFVRYICSFVFVSSVSAMFLIYINSLELAEMFHVQPEIARSNLAPFFSSLFTNSFVLFMQELVILRERKAKVELENAQLKIENTQAINQQLKQHIHPHFLFNSLSILKSLIHNNPALAEEYIIRLSDFLRISVSSGESQVVMLKDELKLCEDFIEMQKIRFGEALQVTENIPDPILTWARVPGFSIQLLVENAIKHNALTIKSPLKITIEENNGWIVVSNNIQSKHSIESSPRSGLANLSKRYRMLSDHDIKIDKSENTFQVQIKILEEAVVQDNTSRSSKICFKRRQV